MNIEINDLLVNDICNRVCNMFEKQTMQNNICQSDAKRQENESKKQESVINAIGALRKINNLVEEESKVESENENEVEPTSKKKK